MKALRFLGVGFKWLFAIALIVGHLIMNIIGVLICAICSE